MRLAFSRAAAPVAALIALVLVGAALASIADDRRRLIEDIEDEIDGVTTLLARVGSGSDTRDIEQARRRLPEISELLGSLESAKGDDSKARDLVSRYPGHLKTLASALDNLDRLKKDQRSVADLAKRCADANNKLVATARDFVKRGSPKGLEVLPKAAEETRRKVDEQINAGERQRREMQRWRDEVRRFSASDGGFSNLRSELHDAADDVYESWEDDWEEAEEACEDLLLGREHPAIRNALAELKRGDEALEDIFRELDRQLGDAVSLLKASATTTQETKAKEAAARAKMLDAILDRLSRVKGADPEAIEVVKTWPDHVKRYNASMNALVQLKASQTLADQGAARCESTAGDLKRLIEQTLQNDPTGVTGVELIGSSADTYAESIGVSLKNYRERADKMRGWHDEALRFDVREGLWSKVGTALRADADLTQRHFADALRQAEDACAELVKGRQQSRVQTALATLLSTAEAQAVSDKLTGTLGESASLLSGLASDSDDRDIVKANEKSQEIAKDLVSLTAASGGDQKTRELAGEWTAIHAKYAGALDALHELKRYQFTLDKAKPQCTAAEKKLDEVIDTYLDQRDEGGLEAIPLRAKYIGKPVLESLEKARSHKSNMEGWRSQAKSFSPSPNYWRRVASALGGSADEITRYWIGALDVAEDACAEIAKGAQSERVVLAVQRLEDTLDNASDLYALTQNRATKCALKTLATSIKGSAISSRWKDCFAKLQEQYARLPKDVAKRYPEPEKVRAAAKGFLVLHENQREKRVKLDQHFERLDRAEAEKEAQRKLANEKSTLREIIEALGKLAVEAANPLPPGVPDTSETVTYPAKVLVKQWLAVRAELRKIKEKIDHNDKNLKKKGEKLDSELGSDQAKAASATSALSSMSGTPFPSFRTAALQLGETHEQKLRESFKKFADETRSRNRDLRKMADKNKALAKQIRKNLWELYGTPALKREPGLRGEVEQLKDDVEDIIDEDWDDWYDD